MGAEPLLQLHTHHDSEAAPLVLGLQPAALVDHLARVDSSLLDRIPGDRGGSIPVTHHSLFFYSILGYGVPRVSDHCCGYCPIFVLSIDLLIRPACASSSLRLDFERFLLFLLGPYSGNDHSPGFMSYVRFL